MGQDAETEMALARLRQLIEDSRGIEEIDEDAWPEISLTIMENLITIPPELMFTLHHSILWDAVNVCPSRIVDFIVDRYLMVTKQISQRHLQTTGSAIAISLIRRVTHECSENIAKLVAPALQNENVMAELMHHLKGEGTNKAGHRLGYIDIVLATFTEIDNLDFELIREPMEVVMNYFIEQGDDPLLKLAMLTGLENTAIKTPLFVKFLDTYGYLDRLNNMLIMAKDNPDGVTDYSDLLYFFACLAASAPEYIPRFKPFLEGMFDKVVMFDCLDAQDRVKVFHRLFTCVASPAAKREMDKVVIHNRPFMKTAMQKVCVNMVTLNLVQRLDLLEGLRIAFDGADPQDSHILEGWFNSFDEGMVPVLVSFMRTVEAAQSIAAMKLAEALLKYDWAYPAFFKVSSFMDFLLDRHIKFEKSDAMQEKYDLVKQIVEKKSTVVDQADQVQLENYVAQGVYFSSRPTPEVDLLDG